MVKSSDKLGVAVVGLGKFGHKRLAAIATDRRASLHMVADTVEERARVTGEEFSCRYATDWMRVISEEAVDIVVVSTSTRYLSEISLAALHAGKHVLCEKPFGRGSDEVWPAVEAADRNRLCLKVGYNHRYHPALEKAHQLYEQGAIGRLHFMRSVYGHGGRTGYDREWRAQSEIAGGGQLLDQGVHILDLFRWFAGEFSSVKAYTSTSFWEIAPLEDNVFALLRTDEGCVASLHASWTNWKNTFTFEAFGEGGFLAISGLGGYYGIERLCWGTRGALGDRPGEQWFEFQGPDKSLELEWKDFIDCIEKDQQPQSSGKDAWRTLKTAEEIYNSARQENSVTPKQRKETAFVVQTEYSGEQTR